MTLGQRIAQKRKELGLSQEGLGERLGVSRQAIYKWESDATLPEIDKLITLSRIFSVSVGWLLGVEEEPRQREEASGELSETQLTMVREIVDRYLAARPKTAPPRRKRLGVCAGLAAAGLVVCLLSLFTKLNQVTRDYDNLRYAVSNVSNDVNRQINSIGRRVEDILKSQNSLTAEYSTELVSTDLGADTASFYLRVVPRTYVEGMTALFVARSGEETVELPVEPGEDHTFTGQIVCPLDDQIDLSVVLITGEKRETQWLEDYYDLYQQSFPELSVEGSLWRTAVRGKGTLGVSDSFGAVEVHNHSDERVGLGWNPAPPASLQVGLFQDQKLVMWYEGRTQTINYSGENTEEFSWFRTREVTLEPEHAYCEAALYTDEYGRQRVYVGDELIWNGDGPPEDGPSVLVDYESRSDPANWEF